MRGAEPAAVVLAGAVTLVFLSLRPSTNADAGDGAALSAEGMSALPSGARNQPSATHGSGDVDAGEGCHFEDRGFGDYGDYHALSPGKLLVREAAVDADGSYELLVHFHGVDAVRKLLAPEQLELVIAGLDAGALSSAYQKALSGGDGFGAWLDGVDAGVARALGRPARARRVTLSSWSAGYGAVDRALAAAPWADGPEGRRLGGLISIDSVHAPLDAEGRASAVALEPFIEAASAAADGGAFFFLTHSEVPTDGYASTAQVADAILDAIDGKPDEVAFGGDDVLPMTRTFDRGRFFVRGYAGADEGAHCAQLRLLPSIVIEHALPP